jgi:hypothetical protein
MNAGKQRGRRALMIGSYRFAMALPVAGVLAAAGGRVDIGFMF